MSFFTTVDFESKPLLLLDVPLDGFRYDLADGSLLGSRYTLQLHHERTRNFFIAGSRASILRLRNREGKLRRDEQNRREYKEAQPGAHRRAI